MHGAEKLRLNSIVMRNESGAEFESEELVDLWVKCG